jgi:nucleoside-diphosphate kinase
MFRILKLSLSLFAMMTLGFLNAEQTLSIIKPDGVEKKHIGEILAIFEKNGLRIAALKMIKLTPKQASDFYFEHKDRPFYADLVKFMSSGVSVLAVLDGENAVKKNRELMGATDPKKAAEGTIRANFSESITKNTVHGSDSAESAKKEISFFFKPEELVNSN